MKRRIRWAISVVLVTMVAIWGCVDEPPAKNVNAAPKDFTVRTLDSFPTYTKLSSLRGKVVLLDFWATWCPPCRETLPTVQKLYRQYNTKGLQVMGITQENRGTVLDFRKDNSYDYPMFLDETGEATDTYGVDGIPHLFVLNKKGEVVYQEEGAPVQEDKLVSAIESSLKQN